jgi:hypothetical protein
MNLKKDLFWLMATQVSDHDQLAPFLLVLWQVRNIMMEKHGIETLLTSWQPESREYEERSGDKIYPHEGYFPSSDVCCINAFSLCIGCLITLFPLLCRIFLV